MATNSARTDEAVIVRIAQAYHWALVPDQPDPTRPPTLTVEKADGPGERLAERVTEKLRRTGQLTAEVAARSIRLDLADAASTALITALHQLRRFENVADSVHEPARRLTGELNGMLPIAASTGSRLRRFFSGRQRQAEARTGRRRPARNRRPDSVPKSCRPRLPPPQPG